MTRATTPLRARDCDQCVTAGFGRDGLSRGVLLAKAKDGAVVVGIGY